MGHPMLALALVVGTSAAFVTDCASNSSETCSGPPTPDQFPQWLEAMQGWAAGVRAQFGINDSLPIFSVPELQWTQTSYIQPQAHPYDLYFYNGTDYTVERYLSDVTERYGGIDSILLWPTYTNLGADDRNQFDMIRCLPGGVDGLLEVTNQLHAAGVRVLWPYNPWDQGTRPQGMSDAQSMAQLLKSINGDGFNGDTMQIIPEDFFKEAVAIGHPIAVEPEIGGDAASTHWDIMGWGYWKYAFIPGVDKWKFLVTKRMTNVCDRWAKNHTDDLQAAFFNGVGFESWENVWGIWNGLTPRDAQAVKIVGALSRFLGGQGLLQSPLWEPHTPVVNGYTVFASMWPASTAVGADVAWTLVNRGSLDVVGPQLVLNASSFAGLNFYDLYHGVALTPSVSAGPRGTGSQLTLSFPMEGSGFGAVLATVRTLDALQPFLSQMSTLTAQPLASYSTQWNYLLQTMVPIPWTPVPASQPQNTVLLAAVNAMYISFGVEIEGDDTVGIDVQYWWEMTPRKEHYAQLPQGGLFIDKHPVTCSEYQTYLKATQYKPVDNTNYLKNWDSSPSGPVPGTGYADKPVTYLSLNEARGYCQWAGGRLPHSYEWQFAGQGAQWDQLYPWGSTANQSLYPVQASGRQVPGPVAVGTFSPAGDSEFGVSDLVGNVWQYTDEFQDVHTRGVLVKGSANYRPSGSGWYFRDALQLNQHNKYFLMSDSYERCGTIGFRCVYDAATPSEVVASCGADTLCGFAFPPYAFTELGNPLEALVPYVAAVAGGLYLPGATSLDWAHWGTNGSATGVPDRMDSPVSLVSDATTASGAPPAAYSNSPTGFSWSDGGPGSAPTAANSTTGVFDSQGLSFSVNVTGCPGPCTVLVFTGAWGANATFTAALGSATYTDATMAAPTGIAVNVVHAVRCTTGGILKVGWTKTDPGSGNVTLQSVAIVPSK